GSAGRYAVDILQRLGCNVTALRCEANGHFPDHAPDPSKEQHLTQLKQTVLNVQAHLGFALDGDGDRMVIVDETGQVICADRLMCLFAKMCLEQHPQHEIVFDVKCSNQLVQCVQAFGGIATMIRTGSTFLRQYIAKSQRKAVFGGEYAGHYVFNDGRGQGYDDGLYAALRIIEYFSMQSAQHFSHLMSHFPPRYCTEDTYIPTYQYNPAQIFLELEQQCRHISAHLTKIDGLRLDFDDGFGIIRASNTGEYFTVRFDANSSSRLAQIRHQFADILEDYPDIARDIRNTH
ncbi:MAG: phosphomannomutase/phosphoglucomutase, partial [Acinetobacter sp.]